MANFHEKACFVAESSTMGAGRSSTGVHVSGSTSITGGWRPGAGLGFRHGHAATYVASAFDLPAAAVAYHIPDVA